MTGYIVKVVKQARHGTEMPFEEGFARDGIHLC